MKSNPRSAQCKARLSSAKRIAAQSVAAHKKVALCKASGGSCEKEVAHADWVFNRLTRLTDDPMRICSSDAMDNVRRDARLNSAFEVAKVNPSARNIKDLVWLVENHKKFREQ
jgi:hypothetical protein